MTPAAVLALLTDEAEPPEPRYEQSFDTDGGMVPLDPPTPEGA